MKNSTKIYQNVTPMKSMLVFMTKNRNIMPFSLQEWEDFMMDINMRQ